jgi:hypothetical protein
VSPVSGWAPGETSRWSSDHAPYSWLKLPERFQSLSLEALTVTAVDPRHRTQAMHLSGAGARVGLLWNSMRCSICIAQVSEVMIRSVRHKTMQGVMGCRIQILRVIVLCHKLTSEHSAQIDDHLYRSESLAY